MVLVAVINQDQDERQAREYIDELEFLADTAGAMVKAKFFQKLLAPNSSTFVGPGKLDEIAQFVEENEIDTIIFDDELTPTQLRNIERRLERKVLDRTNLILDIFAKRAQQHMQKPVRWHNCSTYCPDFTRMWTHFERQRGGIGMRGPGETQIEPTEDHPRQIARLKEQ